MTSEPRPSTSDLAAPRRDASPEAAGSHEPEPSAEVREEPLLPLSELDDYRARWESVQGGFVDEPREAVAEADELVAQVMQRLADSFSGERSRLESQWDRGDEVSTEELRVALQRYRSFFDRLLRT